MAEMFQFVRCDFRRLWISPRPYIVLLVVYMGLHLCFGGAETYLAENGQSVQAMEFFVFATANRIPQWILAFGILLLLGDAPFFHEGMELYVLRSRRSRWLTGQILFCCITVLGYLLLVAGMFLLMFHGHIYFANTWSDAITLICRIGNGTLLNIKMAIDFPMQIITNGSPYAMFGLSFLYSAFLLLLFSLLCMVCNTKLRTGVGCFVIAILLVWRVLLDTVGGMPLFHYISPCNLANVGDKPVSPFYISYTIMFFIWNCCLLCIWMYGIIQKYDLQRKDRL